MGTEQAEQPAVVLTTDCGADMDDQWALVHLALSPEVRLLGVVTNHAPNLAAPAAETAARVANTVLDWLPQSVRPPVVAGASTPLADRDPQPNRGVDLILELSHGHSAENRLVVLAIGAATDVASALLIDPSLGERIDVVAMGFEGWPGGHDPFNVQNDVRAWQVLLQSGTPVTVGDASVTQRLTMTRQRAWDLFGDCGDAGSRLVGLLGDWLDAHPDLVRRVTGHPDAWPIWDEIVVGCLLGLTASETYPRPTLRDDLSFDHRRSERATISWITDVDADRLWLNLREKLRATDQRSSATSAR